MFYGEQLVYLLVLLVCYKTMALKIFFFRENWVGSEVGGIEIAIFVIFEPTWTHILALKRSKCKILYTEF